MDKQGAGLFLAYGLEQISAMTSPLTVRAHRQVLPNGSYHFPRAIEGATC